MMQLNTTPGPWVVHTEAEHNIGRTTSVYICRGDEAWPNGQLARVNTADELGSQLANANLIASAPDLYAALEYVARSSIERPVVNRALVALAKARGET